MKAKRYKNTSDVAQDLGLERENGELAMLKANLTKEILKALEEKNLTHQDLADLSGVPRSAITGIINGSLQKVTIDRLIRLVTSLNFSVDLKLKSVA